MDPVTMMVASIGMQFFNNYANNKKNEEIQEKQREFQRAAAEHDFERMRKLQAESAKLALELEEEVHKERVEDINNNYDALLDNFAHSFAIQNWPLNVLPFVMKGESFGTLFNGTTQSVNMHCIFTPSNCEWFNKNFYDDIDLRLEAEMNSKWNTQTTHPIVYYGGAWNRRSMNKGISFPNSVDLDDIELLRIKLKDIPVVVVTPYFDPWLHFKVRLWGMGKDSETPYRIDIPHGDDIEFSQRIFSYNYHKDDIEITEDFENTTIEEFVPYLEYLIGFIADKYFWSMYGICPQLPTLLCKQGEVDRHKIEKLCPYAKELDCILDEEVKTHILSRRSVKYFDAIKDVLPEDSCEKAIEKSVDVISMLFSGSIEDFKIIQMTNKSFSYKNHTLDSVINEWTKILDQDVEYIFIKNKCIEEILIDICKKNKNTDNGEYFIYTIWNSNVIIGTIVKSDYTECIYEQVNHSRYFVYYTAINTEYLSSSTIYIYNIINKKHYSMKEKKFEDQFSEKFARIGKSIGRVFDDLSKDWNNTPKSHNSIWEIPASKQQDSNDITYEILQHFLQNAGKSIPVQKLDVATFQLILDWIDKNVSPFATKVYLVKDYNIEHNRNVMCLFMATEDAVMLGENDAKCCIISNSLDSQLDTSFGDNNICIIPLK